VAGQRLPSLYGLLMITGLGQTINLDPVNHAHMVIISNVRAA